MGLRKLTAEEIALHKAAGGGPVDYDKIEVIDGMPTPQEIRDAATSVGSDMSGFSDQDLQDIIDRSGAMSLPNGIIYVLKTESKAQVYVPHEIEHQSEYQNMGAQKAFEQLVQEAQMANPYNTPGTLENHCPNLENKAQSLLDKGWIPPATYNGVKNK